MIFAFIIIAIVPVIGILYYVLHQDKMDAQHKQLLFRTAFFGMFAVPLVLAIDLALKRFVGIDLNLYTSEQAAQLFDFHGNIKLILQDLFGAGIVLKLLLGISAMAFIEEYSKNLIVREVDWNQKSFNRIIDGVEFSIAAALGFAFIENIVYFYMIKDAFLDMSQIIPALTLRATLSTCAHVIFSGIFGYYYGKAKFVGHTRPLHSKHVRKIHHFHLARGLKVRWHRLSHFFQGKNLHHHDLQDVLHQDELIAEGIIIATLLHTLFNFLLTLNLGYLVIPFLALEYAMIAHEFHSHQNFVKQQNGRREA